MGYANHLALKASSRNKKKGHLNQQRTAEQLKVRKEQMAGTAREQVVRQNSSDITGSHCSSAMNDLHSSCEFIIKYYADFKGKLEFSQPFCAEDQKNNDICSNACEAM